MADPLSLTIGIISAFKDAYFVGKYIYKTYLSAKNYDAEKQEFAQAFRHEVLFLGSFGRWFSNAFGKVTDEPELDQLWLEDIIETFERLSEDFAEYRRLASEEDNEYKQYSPNSPTARPETKNNRTLNFQVNSDVPKAAKPAFFGIGKYFGDKKIKQTDIYVASKWALFQKRRLERVLEKFRKRNKQLQEVLPLAVATRLQSRRVGEALKNVLEDEDATFLGLTAHVKIQSLVTRIDHPQTDLMLKNAKLSMAEEKPTINTGAVEVLVAKGNILTEDVLIEFKNYASPPEPTSQALSESDTVQPDPVVNFKVNQLGSILRYSGLNKLGTLELKGIIHQHKQHRHAFLFYYPDYAEKSGPLSLHSIIETQSDAPWPLSARFRIAQHIARAIGAFHGDGWVHKSIRSHSVVFFKERDSENLLTDSPYLVDFEYSRPESGSTLLLRDNDEEKNFYRHPDIQDIARSSFAKVHDLYSLGVVLLEIAVWQTARSIQEAGRPQAEGNKRFNAKGMKELFIKTAKRKIPHLMGDSYLQAVLACLESRFSRDTYKPEFSAAFRTDVTRNLSPSCLASISEPAT
ncbi:hypothetical protein AOQ84DRAFT_366687 [Glonium stellatum]|uniref:Protein kinase domain-containing protein n=1 Tax=Glonium stellatum TaxID=574774 RepID=A0A8E2EVE9_9PEZI|nr:hypothetical protein AOQ84DRAFT_366687 [Glonium stellatum]